MSFVSWLPSIAALLATWLFVAVTRSHQRRTEALRARMKRQDDEFIAGAMRVARAALGVVQLRDQARSETWRNN